MPSTRPRRLLIVTTASMFLAAASRASLWQVDLLRTHFHFPEPLHSLEEGGTFAYNTLQSPFLTPQSDHTWIYDLLGRLWQRLDNPQEPPARDAHSLVALDEHIIIFGGRDAEYVTFGDLWSLDVTPRPPGPLHTTLGHWENMTLPQTKEQPAGRCFHAACVYRDQNKGGYVACSLRGSKMTVGIIVKTPPSFFSRYNHHGHLWRVQL